MRGGSAAEVAGAGAGALLPGGEVALGVEGALGGLSPLQLGGHLGPGDTFSVEVLGEVQNHIGLDVEGSGGNTVMDALCCDRHLAENPHFESTISKLLTLKIRHFQTQVSHQIVIEKGGRWCWVIWRHQARERTALHAEDILLLIISIHVAHCWFINVRFHFRFLRFIFE